MKIRFTTTGFLIATVFISLAFTVSGCAPKRIYPGEKLPADQVATIEIGNIELFMFDEYPFSGSSPRKLEILPGEHVISATLILELYENQPITYTFNAEAGHRYLFDADYKITRGVAWKPWIKDLGSGEIVGGWK